MTGLQTFADLGHTLTRRPAWRRRCRARRLRSPCSN